jgi:hypothetical protein
MLGNNMRSFICLHFILLVKDHVPNFSFVKHTQIIFIHVAYVMYHTMFVL